MEQLDKNGRVSVPVLTTVMTTIILAASAGVFSTFIRPQIVMASDLETVEKSVNDLHTKIDNTLDVVKLLAENQTEQKVNYLQDQILVLDSKALSGALRPDEVYRLKTLKNDLEKVQRKRDKANGS